MCGRYSIVLTKAGWRDRFDVEPPPKWRPVYNASPGQQLPILTADNPRQAVLAHWGLQPSWAKEKIRGQINARAETVAIKPFFRAAFQHHRVIVPADGFYEWSHQTAKSQPYRIVGADDKPLYLAGVADTRPGSRTELGYAIITKSAESPVDTIHDRCPVIFTRDQATQWLDRKTSLPVAADLLQQAEISRLKMYPVDPRLNVAHNNDASLIKPLN